MTSEPGTSSVPGSQVTTTDCVSAHPGVGSPSETVAVRVTGPGLLQTKEGVGEVASLKEPEAAIQWYASGAGPPSASCAETASAKGKPTAMSAGFAETPSMIGQTLTVPLTSTLPVLAGRWQSIAIVTLVV